MADELKNQIYQAKNRARELLDLNNSARSATSDNLFSVLEAGEWSFISRDQIDQLLHNYLEWRIRDEDRRKTIWYDWTKLRQDLSIKDKIAYITANIVWHLDARWRDSTANFNDSTVRRELNKTICHLETKLLKNKDFTESRILRNSAINRFECKLNVAERNELNWLANNLKTFCNDNWVTDLVYATDFTNESDAQKIMKIYEVLWQLSAIWLNPPENTVKWFEKFDEKIKPLKDLDEHFKHMTKTLNMIHRVAQKSYHSMVTPNQKETVQKILNTIWETENVNKTLSEYNQIEKFKTNNEHTLIEDVLKKVQDNPKYEETLLANWISKAQFNEWFISLNSFILTEWAKRWFEAQKEKTFWARTKDFEADTQSRRWMVRRRLFEIADRMIANWWTMNNLDFDTANSYFDKFKDLFFAKEEDNYRQAPNRSHENHYDKMAMVTAAIIRRRVPALDSRRRIWPGSAWRRMFKYVEHALKWTNRGLFNRIRRVRHSAGNDDAMIVAILVMAQNQATNQMFYQDKNQFNEREERRYSKIFRRIRFAEDGRKAVRDAIAPTANKALQLTEIATKKWLQLASGTVKVTNTVASKWVRWVTRATWWLTGLYNWMIEKKWKNWKSYKRRKTPLYLPYILTKPIQEWSKLLNKWATWTDKNLNGEIKKIDSKVWEWYEEAKKVVAEATGEETKYLFQWLTYATDQVTSLVGKTISAWWKAMHDAYTTWQQRSILGAFYHAACEQKWLEDLMQSSELGDILNLKENWPELFDGDGRFMMVDKAEVKEKNDLEPKVEDIKNQIKEYESEFKNRQDSLESKLDTFDLDSPEYANTKKELDRLVLILNTIWENQTDINDIIKKLENLINNRIVAVAPDTVEDIFLEEITDSIDNLKQRKDTWKTDLETQKTNLKTNENELEQKKSELEKTQKTLEWMSENDPSARKLISERKKIKSIIKQKEENIITKKEQIEKFNWDKKVLEKSNEYLEQDKRTLLERKRKIEEEIKKLEDDKIRIINLKTELEVKNTEKSLKNSEIENTNDKKEKERLQKELRQIELRISTITADIEKIKSISFLWQENYDEKINEVKIKLNTLDEQYNNTLDELKENDSNILKINISKTGQEILIEEKEISKLETDLKSIDDKLSHKATNTKSRSDTKHYEENLENEIKTLEKEKNKLNKDISTQTEKNRIYDKASRRWEEVKKLANELIAINWWWLSDEEKGKMKKKLLKDTNIDFNRTIERKIDLSSISEDNARQLFEDLNKKYWKAA